MKQAVVCVLGGLFFGVASLPGSVIHGTSSYGSPNNNSNMGPSDCGPAPAPPAVPSAPDLCYVPAGVTVAENAYPYSNGSGEVFAFQITSPTSGDFTLTLTGTEPFIPYSINNPQDYPFGSFIDGDGGFSSSDGLGQYAVDEVDPSAYTTASANPIPPAALTNATLTSVTFTVDGPGDGVAFYAIESDGGTVTATFQYQTPEPRLLPIALTLLLAATVLFRRVKTPGSAVNRS